MPLSRNRIYLRIIQGIYQSISQMEYNQHKAYRGNHFNCNVIHWHRILLNDIRTISPFTVTMDNIPRTVSPGQYPSGQYSLGNVPLYNIPTLHCPLDNPDIFLVDLQISSAYASANVCDDCHQPNVYLITFIHPAFI